jgi:hypothetical protein
MLVSVDFALDLLLDEEGSFPGLFTVCKDNLLLFLFNGVILHSSIGIRLYYPFFIPYFWNISMLGCIHLIDRYNLEIGIVEQLFDVSFPHLNFFYLVESLEFFHGITQILYNFSFIFVKDGDDKVDPGQQ